MASHAQCFRILIMDMRLNSDQLFNAEEAMFIQLRMNFKS
jgi:hypothetical protein